MMVGKPFVDRLRDFWHAVYKNPSDRAALAGDYASIGAQHQNFLKDVAIRGGVFSPAPMGVNPTELAILEGRRQLALELIDICRVHPQVLFDVAANPNPRKGRRHDDDDD